MFNSSKTKASAEGKAKKTQKKLSDKDAQSSSLWKNMSTLTVSAMSTMRSAVLPSKKKTKKGDELKAPQQSSSAGSSTQTRGEALHRQRMARERIKGQGAEYRNFSESGSKRSENGIQPPSATPYSVLSPPPLLLRGMRNPTAPAMPCILTQAVTIGDGARSAAQETQAAEKARKAAAEKLLSVGTNAVTVPATEKEEVREAPLPIKDPTETPDLSPFKAFNLGQGQISEDLIGDPTETPDLSPFKAFNLGQGQISEDLIGDPAKTPDLSPEVENGDDLHAKKASAFWYTQEVEEEEEKKEKKMNKTPCMA